MKTFVKIMIVFSLLIVGTVAGMLALLGFVCGGLNSECLQFSINNTAYAESNSQPVIIINSDSPINAPDEGNGRASDEVPNTPETAVSLETAVFMLNCRALKISPAYSHCSNLQRIVLSGQ